MSAEDEVALKAERDRLIKLRSGLWFAFIDVPKLESLVPEFIFGKDIASLKAKHADFVAGKDLIRYVRELHPTLMEKRAQVSWGQYLSQLIVAAIDVRREDVVWQLRAIHAARSLATITATVSAVTNTYDGVLLANASWWLDCILARKHEETSQAQAAMAVDCVAFIANQTSLSAEDIVNLCKAVVF